MNDFFSKQYIQIALLITGIFLGFGIGFYRGEKNADEKFLPLFAEARKFFQPIPEFSALSGTVTDIGGGEIFLSVAGIPQNPFDKIPMSRRALVDDTTVIVRIVPKPRETYMKEFDEYQEKLRSAISDAKPPTLIEEEKISLSKIKKGDIIIIHAAGSIKQKTEFFAQKVVVQQPRDTESEQVPGT